MCIQPICVRAPPAVTRTPLATPLPLPHTSMQYLPLPHHHGRQCGSARLNHVTRRLPNHLSPRGALPVAFPVSVYKLRKKLEVRQEVIINKTLKI